jgi:hypothetical protein
MGDGEMGHAELREQLSLTENQLDPAVHALLHLGILTQRRRARRGGGEYARLMRVEPSAFESLPPKDTDWGRLFESLPKLQLERLQRFDYRKAKLRSEQRARNVAALCAAIGTSRQISQAALAGELKSNGDAVWKAIRDGGRMGLVSQQRVNGRGRKPSVLTVNWPGFDKFRAQRGARPLDLSFRPTLFYERKPQEISISAQERTLLDSIDVSYRQLDFKNLTEWLNVKTLLFAIGTHRRVSAEDLAAELRSSTNKVKVTARCARERGVLDVRQDYSQGRLGVRSDWHVKWQKIESAAGEQAKAETNGHTTPANNIAARKAATAAKVGRPTTTAAIATWILNRQGTAGVDRETAIADWQNAHPGSTLPKRSALRAALSREAKRQSA